MDRREFLGRSILILGGALIGGNISRAGALNEMLEGFADMPAEGYDVVINGAGISGFFAALDASRRGLRVLVTDRRTSPGFDIAAKRRLWLGAEGFDRWNDELKNLFFPEGELPEIGNGQLTGEHKSRYGDQLLLFPGSIKKGLLRTLLANGVDVLLMTDVCGVVTDGGNHVSGVIVASKHGLYSIACGHFIDASDNCLFSRRLSGEPYAIDHAGFVFEVESAGDISERYIPVGSGFGIEDDRLSVHKGKKHEGHYLFGFRFRPSHQERSSIEQQARTIAFELSKAMPSLSPALAKARMRYYANECSYEIAEAVETVGKISEYDILETPAGDYTCATILDTMDRASQIAAGVGKYSSVRKLVWVYHAAGVSDYKTASGVTDHAVGDMPHVSVSCEGWNLPYRGFPMLVVGGGTAGTMVAVGAVERGCRPTIVEYFNDLGGTQTMSGVSRYYFGNQAHNLIKSHEKDVTRIAREYNLKLIMPYCRFHMQKVSEGGGNVVNGAICCGADVKNGRLESIVVCYDGGLERFSAPLTVDATGDANVAYLAGEKYDMGNERMGVTQNYSQWDIPFNRKVINTNRDYDLIDNTLVREAQRGLYLAHYESHYYDFYPLPGIRESRRPRGVKRIDIRSIIRQESFPDTIAQARSDYDPHYFGTSELTRSGMMLPHFDNRQLVNIPYGAIVPATIDGLLLSAKGISQTSTALQYTRMVTDISVLGYVTGLIAAEIVSQGVRPRDFSVSEIQRELRQRAYLPEADKSPREDVGTITAQLVSGNESYLLRCAVEESGQILPSLKKAFARNKSLLLASALAWHGSRSGEKMLIAELGKLYAEETLKGHPSTYYETYDPSTLYWRINRCIVLLAMCGGGKSRALVNSILERTSSGGACVVSDDAYFAGRIDLRLIPYYNRIVNLCFYIERNPDSRFAAGLERLLDDENIKGYATADYYQSRWTAYGANLELFVASAAARCGSAKGVKALEGYLDDVHSDFRRFAAAELDAASGADKSYKTKIEL